MSYGTPELSAQKMGMARAIVGEPAGHQHLDSFWSWPVSVPPATGSPKSKVKWDKVAGTVFAVGFSAGAWAAVALSVMGIVKYLR
jgi:hypothetical protein